MKDVFIRRKHLHGNLSELLRCQVLSENGDKLRVKPEGSMAPIEINRSEVMPANKMTGAKDRVALVQQLFPTSAGAMHNRLPR